MTIMVRFPRAIRFATALVAPTVFAFTMASMVVSDLRIIGQVGTTIGLGLLFDTLIVRAFMTPSIAALLGRWFWWPINVLPHVGGKAARHREAAEEARGSDADVEAPEEFAHPRH